MGCKCKTDCTTSKRCGCPGKCTGSCNCKCYMKVTNNNIQNYFKKSVTSLKSPQPKVQKVSSPLHLSRLEFDSTNDRLSDSRMEQSVPASVVVDLLSSEQSNANSFRSNQSSSIYSVNQQSRLSESSTIGLSSTEQSSDRSTGTQYVLNSTSIRIGIEGNGNCLYLSLGTKSNSNQLN